MNDLSSLWPHQLAAIEKLENLARAGRSGGALFMGMSTGKTRTAMAFCAKHNIQKILILCRKRTNHVWLDEARDWGYTVTDLTDGTTRDRAALLKQELTQVYVVNYDAITFEPFKSTILRIKWDVVIADEVQALRSFSSKRGKTAARVQARFRIALTGTPFHNSPLDVWGIHRFISPIVNRGNAISSVFGSWVRFREEYAQWGGYNGYELMYYKNLDKLAQKVHEFSYSVSTTDVINLPDAQTIERYTELEPDVDRFYKTLDKQMIAEIKQNKTIADNVLVKMLRLQQATGGYAVFDDGETTPISTAKAELLNEVLEELEYEPVVVFYKFNTDLETIMSVINHQRREVYYINGKGSQLSDWKNRAAAGHPALLFVQVSAGSEGISLIEAKYVVYYSIDWSLGTYEQSLMRVRRYGQTADKVTYVHLYVKDTIDEEIHKAIKGKQSVTDKLKERIKDEQSNYAKYNGQL